MRSYSYFVLRDAAACSTGFEGSLIGRRYEKGKGARLMALSADA